MSGLINPPVDVAKPAGAIAAGATLGLQQQLLAEAGQPGLTVLAVGYTNTGRVQMTSLGGGNVVRVYADGADFAAGTIQELEFMGDGEVICFTGVKTGSIITTTQGAYGFSEVVFTSTHVASMPLLSYGLNSTETFMFSFRESERTTQNHAFIFVINGPLVSEVSVLFGDGSAITDQPPQTLQPWQLGVFHLDGNTEYLLKGTNGFMPCTAAGFNNADYTSTSTPVGAGPRDARILFPPSNDVITHPRFGQMSAPTPGTEVNWYTSSGVTGNFSVVPGSPVNIQTATGQAQTDYNPVGFTRFRVSGTAVGNSGADGAGGDATPACPILAMSQKVAQPIYLVDSGNGDQTSLTFAGPYEGTVKVYEWDVALAALKPDPTYTVPMIRQTALVTPEDQFHPAAGQLSNEPDAGVVPLVGTLAPGLCVADVPFMMVIQSNGRPSPTPQVRSQRGTATDTIIHDDDETLMLGITPEAIAMELRVAADGFSYIRELGDNGIETWRRA